MDNQEQAHNKSVAGSLPLSVTNTASSDSGPQYVPSTIGKLANVDPQLVLDRVAAGEMLREIAVDYGCSAPAVSMWIRDRVPALVWHRVRELSIASRLERSSADMETAGDALNLARARESARLWMWRAEREHPTLYGQRPSVAINNTGPAQINIVSYGAEQQSTDNDTDAASDQPSP